jgi:hypothetical protein
MYPSKMLGQAGFELAKISAVVGVVTIADDICVLQDAAGLSAAFYTPCRLSHVGHKTNMGIRQTNSQ